MAGLAVLGMILAGAGFAAVAAIARRFLARKPDLSDAARLLGIDPWQLDGHVDGFTVRISGEEVVLEGIDPAIGVNDGTGGIRTGDPGFDAAFRISGAATLAAMHPAARKTWLTHIDLPDLRASKGRITARVPWPDTEVIAKTGRQLVDLANALRFEGTVNDRLVGLASFDTHPGVRRHALEVLLGLAGAEPQARAAFAGALRDPDRSVRLFAAMHLGESGWEALESLALDPGEDAIRAEALRACAALPAPRRRKLIETVCEVLSGKRTLAAAVELIAGLTEDAPFAEKRLIAILEHPNDERALARIVDLLGAVGSADSLEPLRRLKDSWRHSSAVVGGAEESIRAIRARIAAGGATAGRLTLAAANPAGALSPVTGEGSLSLPETSELPAAPRKQTT